MGQCVSTKAAAVGAHNSRPMSRPLTATSKISDEVKDTKRPGSYTRGVATSFGFKKRPETAIPLYTDNSNRKQAIDTVDDNGNDDSLESLENNTNSLPRNLSRLPAPKKESNATSRVSRFGFRQTNSARTSRESPVTPVTNLPKAKNNNIEKPRAKGGGKTVTIAPSVPKHKINATTTDNKNRNFKSNLPQPNVPTKYTLHSSQLPKPQLPVRVMETKTAKTAANINRKVSTTASARSDEGSSKEGSITGDSGVGSQTSGTNGNGDTDTLQGVELLDSSPHLPVRRSSGHRPRNLEMVVSGKNFDVRDLDDYVEDGLVTEVAVIPLPRLPSVFASNISTGMVRERTREYQRQLSKISTNTRESFSEDYGEEEKSFRDLSSNEKSKPVCTMNRFSPVTFQAYSSAKDLSPPSSDENGDEWAQAGEAMLDSNIYHFSSSDESKERERSPPMSVRRTSLVSPIMECTTPMTSSYTGAIPKNPSLKSVLLTIEDPFAAVAAKSFGTLLDDETSPQDSLLSSFTESEDLLGNSIKKAKSSKSSCSGSKEMNEKSPISPTSPGTPTNTSLSLSEGRDFLIDDEIADQPALMFNENLPVTSVLASSEDMPLNSEHNNMSDSIATLVETPKRLRKYLGNSIAASIDTLSPCESIASDDMMLDFEHSQSSGIDDSTDRLNESSALHSLDEATLRSELELQNEGVVREWSSLLGTNSNKDLPPGVGRPTTFLRSRTATPSSVPDSPRLLNRQRIGATNSSPLARPLSRTAHSSPANYDSDDAAATAHDLVEIKSLVLKLQNVLQETDGDFLTRKEPLNSFDNQAVLKNGIYGLKESSSLESMEWETESQLADLRKQVLFLQSQLEDRDRTVQQLQGRVAKYSLNAQLKSPHQAEIHTCNAATQTDRVRPLSAGPSLLQSLPTDGTMGPLVSANEYSRRTRPQSMVESTSAASQQTPAPSHPSRSPPLKLWRKPGEPPPPARYMQQSPGATPAHQRSHSRTRVNAPLTTS